MRKVYSNWVRLICLLTVGAALTAGLMWAPVRAQDADAPTVLITGSNRGIGLEFARQYAVKGWNVIATTRNPDSADELNAIADAHSNLIVETLDVTDLSGIAALAEKYEGTGIDVLINNAGILGNVETQELGQFDYANFQQIMAVNTFGPLAVSQAFLDHVSASDQKKIVTLASGQGSSTLTQ